MDLIAGWYLTRVAMLNSLTAAKELLHCLTTPSSPPVQNVLLVPLMI